MTTEIAKPVSNHTALATLKAEFESASIIDTGAKADNRLSCPYIGFFGAHSRNTEPLRAVGLKPYDFYLHDQYPIAVKPFEMHVLRVAQFYTKVDNDGRPDAARLDCPDEAFKDGFRSHLFFVAAVRQPKPGGGVAFVPAVGTLRSGQTGALRKALSLLGGAAANEESWKSRGPKEADSAHAKLPGGRFITTIWSEPKETDVGDMNMGYGTVRPTPRAEVDAFNEWYAANINMILAVAAVNNARVKECQGLIGG